MIDTAFEIVTLLPGFTRLGKRSGELDGNLPVRAARYCGPVFEGSAAGFQIMLAQPMTVRRSRRGKVAWDLTPPTLQLVTEQVDEALQGGLREGLLTAGGYWHRLLAGDALPVRGNRVLIWTGHLIRPRPGMWLLVGGALNRRSRVPVVDHLVTDSERFVPLIVELDARALGPAPAWMEAELACITPVVPKVRIKKERLQPGAAQLREFGDYFSEAYFETKGKHPTASYIKQQRDRRVKAVETCEARLLFAGPDVHTVGEFRRFITATGFSTPPARRGSCNLA
jgi:hypothetical protein